MYAYQVYTDSMGTPGPSKYVHRMMLLWSTFTRMLENNTQHNYIIPKEVFCVEGEENTPVSIACTTWIYVPIYTCV